MSGFRGALRALGRAVVQGLATENGWCWAACTLGTFPIGTALAAHRSSDEREPRAHLVDEAPVRPAGRAAGQAWAKT